MITVQYNITCALKNTTAASMFSFEPPFFKRCFLFCLFFSQDQR
uniref:Uncharacterized protein n=1 Tax=Anguilla anguilla TaxID=7936 RepID=A0A0E9WMG5_ANGAN